MRIKQLIAAAVDKEADSNKEERLYQYMVYRRLTFDRDYRRYSMSLMVVSVVRITIALFAVFALNAVLRRAGISTGFLVVYVIIIYGFLDVVVRWQKLDRALNAVILRTAQEKQIRKDVKVETTEEERAALSALLKKRRLL